MYYVRACSMYVHVVCMYVHMYTGICMCMCMYAYIVCIYLLKSHMQFFDCGHVLKTMVSFSFVVHLHIATDSLE